MVTVLERDLRGPTAVRPLFQRICVRAPIVKITDYRHMLRLRSKERKICGPEIVLCRIAIRATKIVRTNVKHPTTYQY